MSENKSVSLRDLVGLHMLSGVDFNTTHVDNIDRSEANVINFVLDGVTYSAIEDPNDGYRSSMEDIVVATATVTNTFAPVQVMCVIRENNGWREYHDLLDCYDVKNGKRVLSVGTDRNDSYYPSFVSDFTPGNMHINDEAQP